MASDYAPTPVEDFLDPDHPTLFPRLTPEQVEYLAQIGTQLSFARGDLVFEHGQRETPLYVVLSGALDIIDQAPEGDRYFTPNAERAPSPPGSSLGWSDSSPSSRPSDRSSSRSWPGLTRLARLGRVARSAPASA